MAPPIQVTFRHLEPTEDIRTKINSLVRQLDNYEGVVISGDVVVEATGGKGEKTEIEVLVELSLPRGRVVAKRSAAVPAPAGQRSFENAATEAFRAAQRQINQHTNKLRRSHETKQLEHQPEYGHIESLNKQEKNGFVEMPDGASLFFSDAVVGNGDFEMLAPGDQVLVMVADAEGPYGPQAASVKKLGPMAAKG